MKSGKIISKRGSLIVVETAEGEVNVSASKHPLAFVRLNKSGVGAQVQLNYEAATDPGTGNPTGRLQCTEWAKADLAIIKATELAARAAQAEATIARAAMVAQPVVED